MGSGEEKERESTNLSVAAGTGGGMQAGEAVLPPRPGSRKGE